ncbi:hypothetical protein [Psychrobacter sp. JCM 18900]|uniref:hypothetical protein n=1 Tax=Psychrobacter sp. JCM 18900 TaxID=1298608 RepID=UPI0004B43073|nr:hypothetical protein [Psychrobacter sp. JCM 18900]
MSRSTLPLLDSSLYPQVWQQQTFTSPQALLLSMLFATLSRDITIDASAFTKQLLADDVYQEWINTTVFGRYLHRNFTAFYQQTEDSFNTDMPALFRQELVRHTQYLPLGQILFFCRRYAQKCTTDEDVNHDGESCNGNHKCSEAEHK